MDELNIFIEMLKEEIQEKEIACRDYLNYPNPSADNYDRALEVLSERNSLVIKLNCLTELKQTIESNNKYR